MLGRKESTEVALLQLAQQELDVSVQRFKFPDEIESHDAGEAKVDDGPPVDVQRSLGLPPLVDDESDELGESDVVTHLQRKRTGFFAILLNDLSADVLVIRCVVSGEFVLVGGDEPLQRMANENEFGVVAHSVHYGVVQVAGVHHPHWI